MIAIAAINTSSTYLNAVSQDGSSAANALGNVHDSPLIKNITSLLTGEWRVGCTDAILDVLVEARSNFLSDGQRISTRNEKVALGFGPVLDVSAAINLGCLGVQIACLHVLRSKPD